MSKTRILIVDDDFACSRLVGLMLEKTGRYEVCVELLPHEALKAAREFEPDIFLLDVDMPGKDGGELARDFKRDPVLAKKPVVFLTSLVSPDEAGGTEIVRGGQRYLAKTTNVVAIGSCIDRVLASAVR